MTDQHFPRRDRPPRPRGLLERAADVFDFRNALSGHVAPPLHLPPEPVSPAPAVTPSVDIPAADRPRAQAWTGPAQPLDRVAMAEHGLLVPGAAVTGLSEEFRIIKRELLARTNPRTESGEAVNGSVVLITSAHPDEGKTFCAVNLAVSLAAESDMEVLLIDADFAKSEVPALLGLTGGAGLMDALVDPSLRIEDLVIRTDLPGLAVLPAGRPSHSDAEHLASSRTGAAIASLVAGRPDRIILFDSPPLLAASAASILAAHADRTLLVVRADRTTEAALRDAAGLLGGCAEVLLMLNGVKFSASGRRFGTYYGKEG